MKKSQNTRTYVGEELKKLINENGDAIIKSEALKSVKAIKVVSEATVTGTQFEQIMNAIGGINQRLDKVDQRLDNIEKDVAAIKSCPTIKRELESAR